MTDSKFRWLLILYVIVTFAAAWAATAPSDYSQSLADAYASEPTPFLYRHAGLASGIGITLMLAAVASVIGLFFFKRWGRTVLLWAVVAELVVYLFSGPTLHSALEDRLVEIAILMRGAILALVYYSPIAGRLSANNSFKPKPLRGSA
ncbi:hypothetical protein [Agrilutibacter solisilvae]|uniref:Uncharacterized protein n=1 Tax=Agrilutibacter solisilvae TaxID=2763317 RepID=A0A975ATJ9_9GAMM|nr:hypothetical protein [Lysobacter solisilvae]QSX79373.1 hypothetical protein I8J32_005795 [Lysobacter solisilvae]